MQKVVKLCQRVAKDEDGAALVEYSILLGVVAVACVALAIAVGGWSASRWAALCTALSATGVGTITCP